MKKILLAAALLCLPTLSSAAELKQFLPGPRLIDGSQLNTIVNAVNSITGHGGGVNTGYFSANTATVGPTALTGTVLQVVGANATAARVELDAYGSVPIFSSVRRNGTQAAPTAILSADQLGSFNFHGASTTALVYGPAARLTSYATENWSSTAGGTKIVFSVTPNTTHTITDIVTIDQNGATSVTSAASTALAVGRLGATTPALLVDASTASSITGVKIKSAGTGSGVAISAIGEASNGALTIDAQGSGTISLGATSTGNIVLGRATTGLSFSGTGGITSFSGTATPAAASAPSVLTFGSAGINISFGTGTPSIAAPQGSIYIQTDGSSSSTRLFIRGSSTWIAVTTAS